MVRVSIRQYRYCFWLSLSLALALLQWHSAWSQGADAATIFEEAPRPMSSGEVAQSSFPLIELMSLYGPGVHAGGWPSLETSQFVFVEERLANAIHSGQLHIQKVHWEVDTDLPLSSEFLAKHEKVLTQGILTLNGIQQLSIEGENACIELDRVCAIRFQAQPNNESQLIITLTPLKLNEVAIQDGHFFKARAIRHQLSLKPNQPLRPQQIQRQLQQIMDNPELSLNAEIEAVELPKDTDRVKLKVNIEDQWPHHVMGYWNNLDQFDYGEYFTGVGVVSNNILGFSDTLAVVPVTDRYTHGITMHYEVPLNHHGTRLKIDSSILKVNPKTFTYNAYDFLGKGWTLGIGLTQPLLNRKTWRLTTDINFEIQQVNTVARRTDVGDLEIEEENLRDIRYGIQWDHANETSSTLIRNEITNCLDIMGASTNKSPKLPVREGGSQYIRYIGSFYHEHSLPKGITGIISTLPSGALINFQPFNNTALEEPIQGEDTEKFIFPVTRPSLPVVS